MNDPDDQGFYKPSVFGFPNVVDTSLKMSMFPLCDLVSSESEETKQRRRDVLLMDNIEDWFAGSKFQDMTDSIVLTTSLGSPPLPDELGDPDSEIFTFSSGVKTARQWVKKYFVGQIINIFLHWRYYEKPGTVCFLDVTENTLLSHPLPVLSILNEISSEDINFSLLETEEQREIIKDSISSILDTLKTWITSLFSSAEDANAYREPLWMIFVFAAVNMAKDRRRTGFHNESGYHRDPSDYDYKLRFYLLKRRGRFLYDRTERGSSPGKVPIDDMPAPAGEKNLTPTLWQGMAQYYRLLSLVQSAVNIQYRIKYNNRNEAATSPLYPTKNIIFRDAHACSASLISADYDRIFFDEAKAHASTPLVMLGVNPSYKYQRHMILRKNIYSWVNPPLESENWRYAPHTFGVLAGVCWFYNPHEDRKRPLFHSTYWPILLLPFQRLRDGIPESVKEEEREELLLAMPGFFNYGLDEYILSRFMVDHFLNPSRFLEKDLLFFTIHWIQAYCGSRFDSMTEYYPLTSNVLHYYLFHEFPRGGVRFGEFVKTKMLVEPYQGLKYIFMNTMFGNGENRFLEEKLANDIIKEPSSEVLQESLTNFKKWFPKFFDGETPKMSCLLDYLHRYDRPTYWLFPSKTGTTERHFSGKRSGVLVPNNRANHPRAHLRSVISRSRFPTDIYCLQGNGDTVGSACKTNRSIVYTSGETPWGTQEIGQCPPDSGRTQTTFGGKQKTRKRKQHRKHTKKQR